MFFAELFLPVQDLIQDHVLYFEGTPPSSLLLSSGLSVMMLMFVAVFGPVTVECPLVWVHLILPHDQIQVLYPCPEYSISIATPPFLT